MQTDTRATGWSKKVEVPSGHLRKRGVPLLPIKAQPFGFIAPFYGSRPAMTWCVASAMGDSPWWIDSRWRQIHASTQDIGAGLNPQVSKHLLLFRRGSSRKVIEAAGTKEFLNFVRRFARVSPLNGIEVHQHPFSETPHWKVSPQASQLEDRFEAENKAANFLSMAQ